jgi:hypothetical protein
MNISFSQISNYVLKYMRFFYIVDAGLTHLFERDECVSNSVLYINVHKVA